MNNQKKFPRTIQIVWNDETQEPEIAPVDVIFTNRESFFYSRVEGCEVMDDVAGDFPVMPEREEEQHNDTY